MNSPVFLSSMAPFLNQFVQYKRALNRKYRADAEVLRLFDRYLHSRHITGWSAVDNFVIDDFLKSRPRMRPRSYNHLLGVVHRFFGFAVMQQWIQRNPVSASPRHETGARIPYLFDLDAAKQLLAVARSLPERSMARYRGLVYETIFALLYGLGLRVGEVVRLTLADADFARDVLFIREIKFCKSRIVPLGPNLAQRLKRYVEQRHGSNAAPERPLFSFTKRGCIHEGTISQAFHTLLPKLQLHVPPGVSAPLMSMMSTPCCLSPRRPYSSRVGRFQCAFSSLRHNRSKSSGFAGGGFLKRRATFENLRFSPTIIANIKRRV